MRLLPFLALLLVPLLPAHAEPPPLDGRLAAGERARHPLALRAGDVLRGHFAGRGLRLTLVDDDGKPFRVLAKGERDSEEFMLVAATPAPAALMVEAPGQGGAYRLRLAEPQPRRAGSGPDTVTDAAAIASPRLRAALAEADTEAFWDEPRRRGGPLVENIGDGDGMVLLTFLWRGRHDNVWLFAAPSGSHDRMRRLADTDIWFASYRVPDTTRTTYKIAPDVPELDLPAHAKRRLILATVQRDPLNPRSFPELVIDIFDGESVVELPKAPPQPWVGRRAGVPAGSVETARLDSAILGNQRDMLLYRPPGHVAGAEDNALLVLFDAEFYQTKADIAAVLDNLHQARAIPPTAALMIANPSNDTRSAELPPNPAFARFLDQEALPWAQARGLSATPARTVVAGSSYGGLAASYVALTLPHRFGNAIGQSSSFWWGPKGERDEWLARHVAALPPRPVRFFLEAGLFEGNARSILQANRRLRDVLRAKGYAVEYHEHAGGHDLIRWRSTLADGLIALLGGQTVAPGIKGARPYSAPSQDTSAVNR